MEHRTEQSAHKMFESKTEQGNNFLHPDYHNLSSGLANYYTYPAIPTSGNAEIQNFHQFMYHYGMNVKTQDQLEAIQFCYPVPSYDSSGAVPYNYCNSGSHNAYTNGATNQFYHLFVPLNNGSSNHYAQSSSMATANEQYPQSTPIAIGVMTNDQSENYRINDSYRVAYKRKHPEVVTGDSYAGNIPADRDLSSASSSQLQHEEPKENGLNVMTPAAFFSPECHENVEVPTAGAQHGSQRSNYHAMSLQRHPQFSYSNYTAHSFQPPGFGWVQQQHENYAHAGCYYNWNYTFPVNYLNGRCLQSGTAEPMNAHMQEYKEATTYGHPSFVFHPFPIPNQHQHLPTLQSMQVHSYSHNTQTIAPYWHPVSSLQTSNGNSSVDDTNSSYRSSRPSIRDEFSLSLHEAAVEYEDDEESWTDSVSDQHGEMRLDIEDMSYEELVALEERIGDVNTGLSEDSILKNLKTSMCAPLTLSLFDISSRLLSEKCVICLVGYEEHERIGTLECGHSYHADCIKEWLLIKNLCPICKTSALAPDRKET